MAGLNETPSGERVHIGFFGVRNAGKSSVVNAVTDQELAVVSDTLGTTTDPVKKAMELLPVGPVVIIDTPGIDDTGELGEMRVRKAREALRRCDVAVLVVDATKGLQQADRDLLNLFNERGIPHVVAYNKADLLKGAKVTAHKLAADGPEAAAHERATAASEAAAREPAATGLEPAPATAKPAPHDGVHVCALDGSGIDELKVRIAELAATATKQRRLVGDILGEGDLVVLVVPIDESAPKGRIILPQQMTIRDILDAQATCAVCQPEQLPGMLESLTQPPALVITDSQVFAQVARIVPDDIPLTSFSILMARYKGELGPFVDGTRTIAALQSSDRVLISEGCTHHRQCKDIGTVKMPAWIRAACEADPSFEFTSGGDFPDDVSGYTLVVHCGGCTLNDKEMQHRMTICKTAGVPIVNYGMAIAHMNGILERTLRPFKR